MKDYPNDRRLSANFLLSEFAVSASFPHLVRRVPDHMEVECETLAVEILQPWRDRWVHPFTINSGYRSEELNKAVGGSPTSQHRRAQAVDFITARIERLFISMIMREIETPHGQLIFYPNQRFIHVAVPNATHATPRFYVSPKADVYLPVKTPADIQVIAVNYRFTELSEAASKL